MQERTQETLDHLCQLALSGDEEAEAGLYRNLRVRFLRVAQRRVREDDVEDLVQDALRVVLLKLRARTQSVGVLPWSMAILRNVIGTHYRSRARREWPAESPTAVDELTPDLIRERTEELDRLSRALQALSRSHPRCGALYREILRGADSSGSLRGGAGKAMTRIQQHSPGMSAAAFYVTLHRCRARLRKILENLEKGKER